MGKVYLLYGQEEYLKNEKIKGIVEAAKLNLPEMNLSRFDDKASSGDIITACQTMPLMDEKRIIIVDNAEAFASDADLADMLGDMADTTVLIFNAKSADMRKAVFKQIKKLGEVFECAPLKPWQTAERIKDMYPELLTQKSAQKLVDVCSNDLNQLDMEMKKLEQTGKKRLSEEDIEKYASVSPDYNVFLLHGYFMKKDVKNAVSLFRRILADEKDAFSTLGLIASKFRLMFKVKSLQGRSAQNIAELTGNAPFEVTKAMEDAKSFSVEQLKNAIKIIAEADKKLKRGEASADTYVISALFKAYNI